MDNMKNVLLITSFCGPGYYIAPPLGLYRISKELESNGIRTVVWDQDLEEEDTIFDQIKQNRFDIIGFSMSHYNMSEDLRLIWKIRNIVSTSGIKCLFVGGGHEITMNPLQWLENGIDVVIPGFAENAMLQLVNNVRNSSATTNLDELVKEVNGYAYLSEQGEFTYKPRSPLTVEEFKKYSYEMMFEIKIPFARYWKKIADGTKNSYFNKSNFIVENIRLYTTSHCKRGCGFCASQSFLHESQGSNCKPIMLSAMEVFNLVVYFVTQKNAKGFMVSDDDFILGTSYGLKRITDFCNLIIDAKQKGTIPDEIVFNCQARIDDFLHKGKNGTAEVNTDLLKLLKKAGFFTIAVGVETFSNRLLRVKSINKKNILIKNCISVLDGLLNEGLVPQINIILGIPEADLDEILFTIEKTSEYIEKGCQVSITPFLMAFPGAPIYSNPIYKKTYIELINPETNKVVKCSNYFLHFDDQIGLMLEKLKKQSAIETKLLIQNSSLTSGLIPKSVVALATFIAFSKLAGNQYLAEILEDKAHSIIQAI